MPLPYQMPSIFEDFKNVSLFPPIEEAKRGMEQAKYGKEPFKVTSYNVKVFDMSKGEDREEYCHLMERLMPLCQDAKCVVNKNELQVLNNSWHRYVEWFEYELNKVSLTTRFDENDGEGEEKDPEDLDAEDSAETGGTEDFGGIW